VSKLNFQTQATERPFLDEAWWSALLADEERNCPLAAARTATRLVPNKTTPASQPKTEGVDWQLAQKLFEQDEAVEMRVTGYNRGGVLVETHLLHGFVPISHLVDVDPEAPEPERERQMSEYIDRVLCLKIIECNAERGRVVLSQRAALAGTGCRNLLFESLQINDCVHGIVTNITDFGVFVDLGGIEGLIHVSELSWGRVRHPSDVTKVGYGIEAMVISLDRERSRIALSLKRLHANPWITAESRYHPGELYEATITSVVPFGVFARLEEGLDGLIHISEIHKDGNGSDTIQKVYEGLQVRVRVLHVDANRQRLGLSLEL
jgi:small subunit ribosomal protein S1